jgi:hypothetical protein
MNKKEVDKLVIKEIDKALDKFMKGQTVGIDKTGEIDYYPQDIERFINMIRRRMLV